MKKWIVFFIGFVLILLGILVKIYLNAVEPVKAAEKKAVSLAEKKVHFSEVHDFHVYHGLETVNVIEGKNKNGENIIVWIPEDSNDIFVKKASSGLSKGEVIQKMEEISNPYKIISVRLGMEKNIPLWEIYYLTDNNLINYYYIHFQTGEWLKKIENL